MLSLQKSHINKIFLNYNYWNDAEKFSDLPSPYLDLFKPELRLKMISLNYCNLTDGAVTSFLDFICKYEDVELKQTTQHNYIRYLDFCGNQLTDGSKEHKFASFNLL